MVVKKLTVVVVKLDVVVKELGVVVKKLDVVVKKLDVVVGFFRINGLSEKGGVPRVHGGGDDPRVNSLSSSRCGGVSYGRKIWFVWPHDQ